MRSRNPQYPRNSDVPIKKVASNFYGMLTGEPASELPDGYSALNKNVIDRGEFYSVRNGSRLYSSLKLGYDIASVNTTTDTITITGVHYFQTGDPIWFIGDDLPAPLAQNIEYFVVRADVNKFKVSTTYANASAGTAINLTTEGTSSKCYYGTMNGYLDHDAAGLVLFVFGNAVYVSDKHIRSLTKVTNIGPVRPSGICMISALDTDAIIFSETGIFKVFLGNEFYYMDLVNKPVPNTLVTDRNQSLPATIYGYLYIFSIATLDESGNSSRLSSTILAESGTCQNDSVKDYGECFFTTPIGVSLASNHVIGPFTVPNGASNITHMPLYRTRNIGEYSGGAGTDVSSEGNRRDFFVWAADIPVAKAFVVTVSGGGATLTLVGSTNKFSINDIGSQLKDTAGNTVLIATFVSENVVTVTNVSGSFADGTRYCFVGNGRGGVSSQSGKIITGSGLGTPSLLTTADVGEIVFVSDGTTRRIKKLINAYTFEVVEDGDFTNLCITFKPSSGNFTRNWNDTLPDDSQGDGRISLSDMYAFANEGSDIYVPRRFALPIPNSNVGVIENGFMVCAKRTESKYYYSQIGDKPYTIGYYNAPYQSRKINGAITFMVIFPSKIIILCNDKTYALILNSATNSGRSAVGESIMELPTAECIDYKKGVKAWQTIKFKTQNLMFAILNDASIKYFDGMAWSNEDLAFVNGKDAVSYKYIKKIDQSEGINAFYSNNSGLKLWFRKWDELENSSTSVYTAVQLTLNDTDTNVQGSLDTRSERGSGLTDKSLMVV
jgi:hypothetical protein